MAIRGSPILVPTVIEQSNLGERAYDIYSRLLKDRIIFLGTDIDSHTANVVIAQLLHLAHEDARKEIYMYINSPGGEVYSGLAILDTMRYIKPPVTTIAVGLAGSMAAVLLAGGQNGQRYALPHSKIMIHQPSSAYKGSASDIEIDAKEIISIKRTLEKLIAGFTDRPLKQISRDMDRDYYMSAEEAKSYGLIDEVIVSQKTPKKIDNSSNIQQTG
jgi:ATP-dependent Clp protease protease subunit